ncbi:MAG: Flp family type IVb pilin [Terriglobales bacterium]
MKSLLTRIWRDDSGQDMAEYAIVLGVIAVAAVVTIAAISGDITKLWNNAKTALDTASGS